LSSDFFSSFFSSFGSSFLLVESLRFDKEGESEGFSSFFSSFFSSLGSSLLLVESLRFVEDGESEGFSSLSFFLELDGVFEASLSDFFSFSFSFSFSSFLLFELGVSKKRKILYWIETNGERFRYLRLLSSPSSPPSSRPFLFPFSLMVMVRSR
jgi:hypothetical protein